MLKSHYKKSITNRSTSSTSTSSRSSNGSLRCKLKLIKSKSKSTFGFKKQHQQFKSYSTTSSTSSSSSSQQQQQPNIHIQPLPFLSKIDIPYEHEQSILQSSTIENEFPQYYQSSLPELQPTVPYVIPRSIDTHINHLFRNLRRVGSNHDNNNANELYNNLLNNLKDKNAIYIHRGVGFSQYNSNASGLNQDQIIPKYDENYNQNWGLVATEDIPAHRAIIIVTKNGSFSGTTMIELTPDGTKSLEPMLRAKGPDWDGVTPEYYFTAPLSIARFAIGQMPIVPGGSILVEAASFSFGLVFNRILGKHSEYYDFIQTLPEKDISQFIKGARDYHRRFAAPMWGDNETCEQDYYEKVYKYLKTKTIGDVVKGMGTKTARFECSPNLNVFEYIFETTKPVHDLNNPLSVETIEEWFEWGYYMACTRWYESQLSHPLTRGAFPQDVNLTAIKKSMAMGGRFIPMIIDFINHSHHGNCFYVDGDLGAQLSSNQIKQMDLDPKNNPRDAIEFTVITRRPIKAGEQITVPYKDPMATNKVNPITKQNEISIAKSLRTSNDMPNLFHLSLARVPHAIEFLKHGEYTLLQDPRYGFYSQLFTGDKMPISNLPLPYNQVSNWMPNSEYLSNNYQSQHLLNQHQIRMPKSIARLSDPGMPAGVNLYDDAARIALNYNDAPLKYFLPSLASRKSTRFISELDPRYLELIEEGRGDTGTMSFVEFDWFGPKSTLVKFARVLAACGFEAPSPSDLRAEIIMKLPFEQRMEIGDISSYEISPQQSEAYLYDKMKQRTKTVIDIASKRVQKKLGRENVSSDEIIDGFNKKIDDENEYGMLIILFLLAQQYQNIATSPLPINDIRPLNSIRTKYDDVKQMIDNINTNNNTSNGNTKPIQVYEPPTIQSSILNYQKSIMFDQNFDYAMTNLHQYHHYSLISHINKVLATRLGLHDIVKSTTTSTQLSSTITTNDVNVDQQHKVYNIITNNESPLLSQEWYRCDGYVKATDFNSTFRLQSIPSSIQPYGQFQYATIQPNHNHNNNNINNTNNDDKQ